MHEQPTGSPSQSRSSLERAIVLQVLAEPGIARKRLSAELGVSEEELESPLRRLLEEAVLCSTGRGLRASPAVRRIDALGLIAI